MTVTSIIHVKYKLYLGDCDVPSVGKWRRNSANSLLVAPSKPRVDFLRFHRSKTEERTLICLTEPDKRGLPLEGTAIALHITFYFLILWRTRYTRSPKIYPDLLSDNHSTQITSNERYSTYDATDVTRFKERHRIPDFSTSHKWPPMLTARNASWPKLGL